jgi:hypothetical protein
MYNFHYFICCIFIVYMKLFNLCMLNVYNVNVQYIALKVFVNILINYMFIYRIVYMIYSMFSNAM